MNKQKRERIRSAIGLLDRVFEIIDECKDAEEESLMNLEGTSLENTERYESIEKSCDYLNEAIETIEQAKEQLEEAMNP